MATLSRSTPLPPPTPDVPSEHHEDFSPSALPMLAQCVSFKRAARESIEKKDAGYMSEGHRQHEQLQALIEKRPVAEEVNEGVEWAYDFIKVQASSEFKLEAEQRLSLFTEDSFEPITFGTSDAIAGMDMFDLKSGEIDTNFWWQFACYGLMQMQRTGQREVRFHALYSRFKKAYSYHIEYSVAHEKIMGLISRIEQAKVAEPFKFAQVNEYCGWCRWLLTCPVAAARVEAVRAGREDWSLAGYHSSDIKDPVEMAKAKKLAKFLKDWCSAVDYAALMMSETQEIPGYKRVEFRGKREVTDLAEAHKLSGFTADEFLPLCGITMGDFEQAWATKYAVPLSTAKKQINEKLAAVIAQRASSFRLIEQKGKSATTE